DGPLSEGDQSSETFEVETSKRPTRNVSRPAKFDDYVEQLVGEDEIFLKRRSESIEKKDKKRRYSSKGASRSKIVKIDNEENETMKNEL
ncbi:hypothetical protein PMAYCL1PPCAC_20790, partial [Pristionchus mayeri]